MTALFDIGFDSMWHIGEAKQVDIRVTDEADEPVDLTGMTLSWRLAWADASALVYITKTTANDITVVAHTDDVGGVKSVARIAIASTDYEDVPGPGFFRHQLYDDDVHLVLSKGDVVLQPAMGGA